MKDVANMSVWRKKTEITRQVRFPFSATICGIWCRHYNDYNDTATAVKWPIKCENELKLTAKPTSCLPRTHPIFTTLSSKTCSGMVSHKLGMMYWNFDAKLSNKTYDFCIFVKIDLKIGTHIDWTYSTIHVYLHRFSRLRFCVCV